MPVEFWWLFKLFSTMSNPPFTILSTDVNFQILCHICFHVALLALMYLALMGDCLLLHEPLRCELFLTIGARDQIFTSVQSLVDDQMLSEVESFLATLAYMWWWSMFFWYVYKLHCRTEINLDHT